jgi:hypothetical protein
MSLRPPAGFSSVRSSKTGLDALDYDILSEMAASLGRAGRKAELSLEKLRAHEGDAGERTALLKEAADAVYAYFIQREFCGFRRHEEVIREYRIPREVLVRLGAR